MTTDERQRALLELYLEERGDDLAPLDVQCKGEEAPQDAERVLLVPVERPDV